MIAKEYSEVVEIPLGEPELRAHIRETIEWLGWSIRAESTDSLTAETRISWWSFRERVTVRVLGNGKVSVSSVCVVPALIDFGKNKANVTDLVIALNSRDQVFQTMERRRFPVAVLQAFVGVVCGGFFACFGVLLAGAGHGWVSGIYSGLAVLVLPIFGIALAYRHRRLGRLLLAPVIIGMIAIDGFLLYKTSEEGFHYLHRLWRAPDGAIAWSIWLLLWLGWQIGVIAVAVAECRRRDLVPAHVRGYDVKEEPTP